MRDWLVVTGGVRRAGGQDRANLELVRYLAQTGRHRVAVVANQLDPEVRSFPRTQVHEVRAPFGSNLLGERLLKNEARRIQSSLGRGSVVLANGGNHPDARVNWVHSVHAAWSTRNEGAPAWRRALAGATKSYARRDERLALAHAELVIANSAKTADDLRSRLGIPAERIEVIYFGAEPRRGPSPAGVARHRIAFAGALGWDRNKGLDIALEAFALSLPRLDPRYRLLVAGWGASAPWQRMAERLGLAERVEFLGFVGDLRALLSEVDLLISPVRYEAYGLAVHEALVEAVPVLVTANAGVAERMRSVPGFLVPQEQTATGWSERMVELLANLAVARTHAEELAEQLGRRSWAEMAADLVTVVEARLSLPD
jgi:glycosyltransferase involved in cell wall biosynthesis